MRRTSLKTLRVRSTSHYLRMQYVTLDKTNNIIMKRLLFFLSAITLFVACDSETDPIVSEEELNGGVTNGLVIDAKWLIEEDDRYTSFEFNDLGRYIVVCSGSSNVESSSVSFSTTTTETRSSSSSILYGDYVSIDESTINMIGFGTVEVVTSDSSGVSISLTLEGESDAVELTSAVVEQIDSTSNTDLFCRDWDFVSYTEDGVSIEETSLKGVLFSKSGTYLVEFDDEIDLAEWKWKSESNLTILLYIYG